MNPWDNDPIVAPAPALPGAPSRAFNPAAPWEADEIVGEAPGPWTQGQAVLGDEPPITDLPAVKAEPPMPGQRLRGELRGLGLGARSVLQGAGSLFGALGGDAFNAIVMPGEQSSYRDAAGALGDMIGLPSPQDSRERVLGDVGEALTGTGLTLGAGGALNAGRAIVPTLARSAPAPQAVPSMGAALGDVLTAQPVLQGVSAATGSAAASGVREGGGGTGAQIAAGLVGGLAPGTIAGVLPGVHSVATAATAGATRRAIRGNSPQSVEKAIQDFAAAGATPSIGQATGNRYAQAMETMLGNVPGGAGRIDRFGQQQAQQVGQKVDDVAAQLGSRGRAVTTEQAGRSINRGIAKPGGFIDRYKARAEQLYGELDSAIPADMMVPASNASSYLNSASTPIKGAEAVSEVLSNPKLATIQRALQADLEKNGGAMPYEALARLRTQVGEAIADAGPLSDQPTRQLKGLYRKLTEDMKAAALASGNPEALRAFNRANNYYNAATKRLEDIEHVFDRSGGGEKVYLAAVSGTKEGATVLRQVMRSLPEEAKRDVSSAFLQRMGRAVGSQQDDSASVFSMNTFLTNWANTSQEAKSVLFGGYGSEFAKNMDQIAKVTSRVRDGSRVFANSSGTARQGALIGQVAGTAASAVTMAANRNMGGAALAVVGSAFSAISANGMARLMTSPAFVRWLARTTEKPTGELVSQLQVLRGIGERTGDEEMVSLADEIERQSSELAIPKSQ